MKCTCNQEKVKRWLSNRNDFERLEGESIVKWLIWFAGMKCDEEKVQIEESGFNKESHIEPLCIKGTIIVREAEDIERYLENHLDYKRKRKIQEKVGAGREALPLAISPMNEVRSV